MRKGPPRCENSYILISYYKKLSRSLLVMPKGAFSRRQVVRRITPEIGVEWIEKVSLCHHSIDYGSCLSDPSTVVSELSAWIRDRLPGWIRSYSIAWKVVLCDVRSVFEIE